MTAWTLQQIQCLDALGIAPMAFIKPELKPGVKPTSKRDSTAGSKPESTTESTPEPKAAPDAMLDSDNTAESTAQRYFYRIGPWYVSAAQQLPVEGVAWLNDLARYANTRVSQVSDVENALDIDRYVAATLTPEQKQQLWAELKARLNRDRQASETAPS